TRFSRDWSSDVCSSDLPLVQDLNMHEEFPDDEIRFPLQQFIRYVTNTSYDELCENYVYTFDFYDKTTLYLTYSVFKDNRDRGPRSEERRVGKECRARR